MGRCCSGRDSPKDPWLRRHSTPCFCISRNIYASNPLWRHSKLLSEVYKYFSSIPLAPERPGRWWGRNPWAQPSSLLWAGCLPCSMSVAQLFHICSHPAQTSTRDPHTNLLVEADDTENSGEDDLWHSFKHWDSLLWPSGISDWSAWAFPGTTAVWCSSPGSTKRKDRD